MTKALRGHGFLIFLVGFTAVLVTLCLVLGVHRVVADIPWSFEKRLQRSMPIKTISVCSGNSDAQAALDKIVARLYPIYPSDQRFPFHVQIFNSEKEAAFATFGGQVYVSAGFITASHSAEEVAGVLAHQLEHIRQRHIPENVLLKVLYMRLLKQKRNWVTLFNDLMFTPEQEDAVQTQTLRRLEDAQVDFKALRDLIARAEALDWMMHHPLPLNHQEVFARFKNGPKLPLLNSAQWQSLRAFCAVETVPNKQTK